MIEDSFNYWKHRGSVHAQQYSKPARPYERPWAAQDGLTVEQRHKKELNRAVTSLQQKKAFLSTYRLSLTQPDKLKLINQIKRLHLLV